MEISLIRSNLIEKSHHSAILGRTLNPGSGQGILAYRAGTRAPSRAAGMHETKNKKYFFLVFSCFMHVSLFKTCRNFTQNISQRRRVIVVATCFLGRLNLIPARTL
jgi:hypothetical protein